MKLSIITCTKNSEKYLDDNIRSVSDQTFHDYEHIFIDGESTDLTNTIIREYESKFPERVRLYSYPPNGIADAMNKGIAHAKGEFIIHLHSDDYFHDKEVLKDAIKFLDQNQCDWIYSDELRVDSSGKKIRTLFNKKLFKLGSTSFISRYLLKYIDFIRHQSVFIKKDIFSQFGYFDKTIKIAMDYEYWLRIKEKTRWLYFNRIVDCFRSHDDGISSSPHHKIETQLDEMFVAKKYMNCLEFYVIRPIFKIIAHTAEKTEVQIKLYMAFIKSQHAKKTDGV